MSNTTETVPAATPDKPTTTTPAEAAPNPNPSPDKPYSALRAALGIAKVTEPKEEKPKDQAPKKEEKKVEAPKADKAEPAEAPKPAESAPVKRIQKQQVVKIEGAEEIGQAAKELANAAKSIQESRQPAKEPEVVRELPETIDPEELQALEAVDPKRFKNLEKRMREFAGKGGKEDQYIDAWKKANPGQEFDGDAEEHADFYEKNEPFVSETDRVKAQKFLREQAAKAAAEDASRKATEPLQREMARERALRAVEKEAPAMHDSILRDVVELSDPEMKGADLAKLKDEHPVLHRIVEETFSPMRPVIAEALALKNGAFFDRENPIHNALLGAAQDLSRQMEAAPEDAKIREVKNDKGKVVGQLTFVPMEEFYKLPKKEQAKHWTIGEDDVLKALQNDLRAEIPKRFKAKVAEIAEFGGSVKRKPAPKTTAAAPSKDAEAPDENETQAPSVEASTAAVAPTPKSDDASGANNKHPSLRKMLGIG